MPLGKTFRVYHLTGEEHHYNILLEQRGRNDALLIDNGVTLLLTTQQAEIWKKKLTRLPDVYGCLGILHLKLMDGDVGYLVLLSSCLSVGKISHTEIFRITETTIMSLRNNPMDVERIQEVKKVLNSGTFYFSWSSGQEAPLNLTLCEQRSSFSSEHDNRFFWNRSLHLSFIRDSINSDDWLLKVMCGGVEIRTVYVGHLQAKSCIISRLSSERAGTRFNVRGTNDDGNVANFVETEQVIYIDNKICSYVQIRGSIPLFWEQPGLQVGSHKVKLSRGSEASAPAFDRHLTQITERYGDQVLINLLGSKESESMLSRMFQNHHKVSRYNKQISYVAFDYHAMCRGGRQENLSVLKDKIMKQLENFGFFHSESGKVFQYQKGTFRTNCLDCLDRTNAVQTFIGLEVLKKQLESLGYGDNLQIASRFAEVFKQMWIQNGDQVSKMYAGTGALEGKSKLKDGSRSVVRTIQNNLLDSSKQGAIDVLLFPNVFNTEVTEIARNLLPTNMLNISPDLMRSVCGRRKDFCEKQKIRISVGTWNVNGGKHFNSIVFKHQSLSEWLLDSAELHGGDSLINITDDEKGIPVDIFAIGFEEIVDLSASNIMAASTQNQREWMTELQKTISRDNKYIYIASTQLVGVCLFLFSLAKHAPHIRDVCTDIVKTGLGGTAGNKGATAIRMMFYNSSLCFVCSHFAAGQSQVNERNSDFHEIRKRLCFSMGRNMDTHDYVFWCGDFNYRIDLANETVKDFVKQKNWPALLRADQLKQQQSASQVFTDFIEGDINFPPTYKYDVFSDDYDTSEKNRIPSYTDRVLYRKKCLPGEDDMWLSSKIVYYGRAELKTSDHRPVIATFDVEILKVDKAKRLEIFQEMLSAGPPDGTIIVEKENEDVDIDEVLPMVMSFEPSFKDTDKNVCMRVVGSAVWAKFSCGKIALDVVEQSKLDNTNAEIKLKTPDWTSVIYKELKLCGNNTVSLYGEIAEMQRINDCPLNELSCNKEDIMNSEILKCLTSTNVCSIDEDIIDIEVEDTPKSQNSSGRSSPILEAGDFRSSKTGAISKIPPRPPPPKQGASHSSQRTQPPQRPPPPRPDSEPFVRSVKHDTATSVHSSHENTIQESHISHPPPSVPPPPPPSLSHHASGSKASSCVEKLPPSPNHPPQVPSRPKSMSSVPVSSQPPPIPARTNICSSHPAEK